MSYNVAAAAVVSELLGYPVAAVWREPETDKVWFDGGDWGEFDPGAIDETIRQKLHDRVLITMAELIAQESADRTGTVDKELLCAMIQNAHYLVRDNLNQLPVDQMQAVWGKAAALVKEHWEAISAVATALDRGERLTGEQVRELIEACKPAIAGGE